MLDLIDTLNTVLLEAAAQPWVPLALLLFCAVDGVFPPVPSESLVIGLAAVSAVTGQPNVVLVLLAGAVGAAIGDLTAYTIGHRVGTRRFAWMRDEREKTAVAARLLGTPAACNRQGQAVANQPGMHAGPTPSRAQGAPPLPAQRYYM